MSKFIDNMTCEWEGIELRHPNKKIFSEITEELTIDFYKIYRFRAEWYTKIRVPYIADSEKMDLQEKEVIAKAKNFLRHDIYGDFLDLLFDLDIAILEEKYDVVREINNKIRDVAFGEQEQ